MRHKPATSDELSFSFLLYAKLEKSFKLENIENNTWGSDLAQTAAYWREWAGLTTQATSGIRFNIGRVVSSNRAVALSGRNSEPISAVKRPDLDTALKEAVCGSCIRTLVTFPFKSTRAAAAAAAKSACFMSGLSPGRRRAI